jgi:hypothetical protein
MQKIDSIDSIQFPCISSRLRAFAVKIRSYPAGVTCRQDFFNREGAKKCKENGTRPLCGLYVESAVGALGRFVFFPASNLPLGKPEEALGVEPTALSRLVAGSRPLNTPFQGT